MSLVVGSRNQLVAACLVVAGALVAASCGGSDDGVSGAPGTGEVSETSSSAEADSESTGQADVAGNAEVDTAVAADTASPGNDGAGAGTLTLGDETITFDSSRCFLEEQDAAAGGGKILFVVQAYGTNANGDELVIDVSRYDEDSQFSGDDVSVDIGDPFSDTAVSWDSTEEIGTVTIDGSTVSADDLTFQNYDDFSELPGSFSITC